MPRASWRGFLRLSLCRAQSIYRRRRDLLAGGGVMRPKRDACRALGLIRVFAGAIAQGRALIELLFSNLIREPSSGSSTDAGRHRTGIRPRWLAVSG
jgi:hypothetical protein